VVKNNSLYTIGLNKKIKDKHPFTQLLLKQINDIKNRNVNKKN